MKNNFLLALALTFVLLGCSDDSSLSNLIVGTWVWESFEVTCDKPEFDIPLMTVDENSCITVEGYTECDFKVTFSDDKTAEFSIIRDGSTNTVEFDYTVNDDSNSFELCRTSGSEEICQTFQVNEESFEYIEDEGDCKGIYSFVKS